MSLGNPGQQSGAGWLLAIDTSTERAGIALGDGREMFTRSWEAGRTQTTSVLPAIDALLHEAEISPAVLAAIAVATGPGTFTSLRVGMSIAKGLVLAREIPLIGIPTLDIAAGAVTDAHELIVVLPAGRGRVVWQRYGEHGEPEPRNTTVPELIESLEGSPEMLVVGELAEAHRTAIEEVYPKVRWQHRDPGVLLQLARTRWLRGEVDDPVTLEPRYLHGVTVSAGPVQDRLKRTQGSTRRSPL
jgi:tRNA threonylcarbamoyladenosine biosynthesis protein TsaB